MATGHIIRDLAEILIIALVVFALIFEFVLHKLEHWILTRHPQIQPILRNLYRELMILGFVSFCFILYIFTGERSEDTKLTFEVAHVFLLLFALLNTFIVSIAVAISLMLSRRWKRLERMDLVKYLEVKDKYRKLTSRRARRKNVFWRYLGWWMFAPGKLLKWRKLHEIMTFHDIRWQFIYYRNLQPDFRFSKFLRKIKFATFIELVEIHPVNWFCLLILVVLDIIRTTVIRSYIERGYGTTSISNFEPLFLISHSAFNMIIVTVLSWKISRVYWKLTKNPATYYDAVDPATFRAELEIAEEEARIQRESLTSVSSDMEDNHRTSQIGRAVRSSLESRSRRVSTDSKQRGGGGGDSKSHQPLYSNLALNPSKYNNSDVPLEGARHSLDMNKRRGDRERSNNDRLGLTAIDSVVKPARYAPGIEDDQSESVISVKGVTGTLLKAAKKNHENQGERMSLEMTAALPTEELDNRAEPQSRLMQIDMEGDSTLNRMSSERRKLRMEALRRLRERERRKSVAIVETAQDVQIAATSAPSRTFPSWVVWAFPRLGRVASAAEKLFWFGSHRFYLFCIENVLFFANVNLSATIAKISLLMKDRAAAKSATNVATRIALGNSVKLAVENAIGIDGVDEQVRCEIREAVRKAMDNATSKKQVTAQESLPLLIVALVLAVVALLYVLLRIAGIMRKYIFVLNNANLIPENTMLQTIQTVNLKDIMNAETAVGTMRERNTYATLPSDSETDDGEGREMRTNLSSFLLSERRAAKQDEIVAAEVDGDVENGEFRQVMTG